MKNTIVILIAVLTTVIGFTGGIIIGEDASCINAKLKCDS